MWCTMCKAGRTIVLTGSSTSITVGSSGQLWASACAAAHDIQRSMHYAWENCPCQSDFEPFRSCCVRASSPAPFRKDIYCSGTITNESVPQDSYVITGEGSNYKITFQEGDYVYLNKGASQGVKVGDEFSVIRSVVDPTEIEWAKWQFAIIRKLGTMVGRRRPRPRGCGAAQHFHRASGELLQLHAARRHHSAVQGAPQRRR